MFTSINISRQVILHTNSDIPIFNSIPYEQATLIRNEDRVKCAVLGFRKSLPNVQPFYAVKANPAEWLVKLLNELGVKFDCASGLEIETVLKYASPQDIIYSNPVKRKSDIECAYNNNVNMTVVDSVYELEKLKNGWNILIRYKVDDKDSKIAFSHKFGASREGVQALLQKAFEYNMNVVGFSFHIGSGGNKDICNTFDSALNLGREYFSAATSFGFNPYIMDIGGGFSGCITEELSRVINSYNFPCMIAEPGRFFASPSYDLVVQVIGKKDGYAYHIDDSIYHNLNCVVHDGFNLSDRLLTTNISGELYKSKLFGMTCDGADIVCESIYLPELCIGDWIYITRMGAYTNGAAVDFNGLVCDRNGV